MTRRAMPLRAKAEKLSHLRLSKTRPNTPAKSEPSSALRIHFMDVSYGSGNAKPGSNEALCIPARIAQTIHVPAAAELAIAADRADKPTGLPVQVRAMLVVEQAIGAQLPAKRK